MSLNNLQPAKGSIKHSKRIGRGAGSGKGGTSTRGNKGAKARSGYHQKIGFEGGQMPIYRRLPKFGFKNINRVEYVGINIDMLNKLAEEKNITDWNKIKGDIRDNLSDFVWHETQRRPMIIPIIMEV